MPKSGRAEWIWSAMLVGLPIAGVAFVICMVIAHLRNPPPITDGQCTFTVYASDGIDQQSCTYQGYRWFCAGRTCTRMYPTSTEGAGTSSDPLRYGLELQPGDI